MSIETGVTEYNLSRPFTYYCKDFGGETEARVITLHEPDFSNVKSHLKLQQMTTRLIMETQKIQKKINSDFGVESPPLHEIADDIEEEAEKHSELIGGILMMCDSVDPYEFVDLFIAMIENPKAKKPVAKVDGKYALTKVHIERMDNNDVLGVACRWCAFFAMPDFLKSGK